MTTAIEVRAADDRDREGIQLVWADGLATLRAVYAPTPVVTTARPAQAPHRLVALIDGAVVGTVRYGMDSGRMHLIGLAVGAQHRRRGVARELIAAAASIAVAHGATRLSLFTIAETGNVHVFAHLGFTVVATRLVDDATSDVHDSLHEAYMEKALLPHLDDSDRVG